MDRFILSKLAMETPPASTLPVAVAPSPLAALGHRASVQNEGSHTDPNAEVERIINLPVVWPLDEEELDAVNREFVLAQAYNEGFRLNQYQAQGLTEFLTVDGLFGPIGVGIGKTLLMLLVAEIAFQKFTQRPLLFVPPQVVSQLVMRDIPWARSRVRLSYPITVLAGRTRQMRMSLAKAERRGLFIMPYSLLSAPDAEDLLYAIDPGLIGCDEAQNVGRRSSARTRRLLRYIETRKPKGAAVSGTITNKGIMEYYHLIKWALGSKCPLPLGASQAFDWAAVVDSDAEPSMSSGPLEPLTRWASSVFAGQEFTSDRAGFRLAFRARLQSAPGVVCSGDADLGTSLIISNRKVENHEQVAGWKELEQLIIQVNDLWVTPSGDPIDCAIHTFKWLYELSAGFYNSLVWPAAATLAATRSLSLDHATELIERAKIHHTIGQDYHRVLRDWLLYESLPNIDTPWLVGQDMHRNGSKNVGHDLYDAWRLWKDADFEGRPDRDSIPVRVCDYKIKQAVEIAKALDAGCILWHHHQEVGVWLAEEVMKAGLPLLHCPAGREHDETIADPKNAGKVVVASFNAHGTGKNLQHFQHQHFMQWPRPAKMAEQTIGRLHRQGQKADELIATTNNTLEFDDLCFAACLNDALYIHQTTGNRQKLIYAVYDPLPKVFPWEVLKERGLKPQILTPEQQRVFQTRFVA